MDTALAAADLAADQSAGHELEVVDLRSLNPLDFDTIAASIRKTGRAVVMHEGPRTLGFGAELAARISEELFYDLEAPVLRATREATERRLRAVSRRGKLAYWFDEYGEPD